MDIAQNKTVLAILFVTLLVSGCTGGGSEKKKSQTEAIQVMEFSAFPNPVPGDQNTRFRMQLKNKGETDATAVYARLFNPPFAQDSSDSKTWRTRGGGSVSKQYRTLEFGNLKAAGEQTPAVPKTATQTFKSPNLDEGRNVDYTFNSYIMYKYRTDATSEVRIMSGDKYRDKGSPRGTASLDNSRGPVKMEIRTPTPIVVYDTTSTPIEKDLCIIVRNKGDGVTFGPRVNPTETRGYDVEAVESAKENVTVSIEDIGSVQFKNGDAASYDPDRVTNQTVQILGGKGVACFTMKITGVSSTIQKTVPLSVKAYYGYRETGRTSVRVEGRSTS